MPKSAASSCSCQSPFLPPLLRPPAVYKKKRKDGPRHADVTLAFLADSDNYLSGTYLSHCRSLSLLIQFLQILECDERFGIPTRSNQQDSRVTQFTSLTSLCGDSLFGMGYECNQANGHVVVRNPPTVLWTGPPNSIYLRRACIGHCWCSNIAPNPPLPAPPGRALLCSDSDSEDLIPDPPAAPCVPPNFRDAMTSNNIFCNDVLYGNLADHECTPATDDIGEKVDFQPNGEAIDYEFLDIGARQRIDGWLPSEQTPQTFISGK